MTDQAVLDYLRRRWRKRLDLTTVEQAEHALSLPRSVARRLRVYRRLEAEPSLWRPIVRFGANPVAVTLNETEKLLARLLLTGATLAGAGARLELPAPVLPAASRALSAVGFLKGDRPAPGAGRFREGLGLLFHTVRVEGEPAFNVP